MATVAQTPSAVAYKSHVLAAMALQPGLVAVDVGCGPATDLAAVADLVGGRGAGLAVGVDLDPRMLGAAAQRVEGRCDIRLLAADAHALPLRTASIDRARTDRALQHVREPRQVLVELRRVLRAAGIAVLAEPDWRTLVIDAEQDEVSAGFVDFTCRRVVRNPTIGREIARLGQSCGFVCPDVTPFAAVVRDFHTADTIFGLTRNARAAVDAHFLSADDAEVWLRGLRAGPAIVAVTMFVTTLEVP
jgi:ubiquinone/menaquinone biosynthesis C-methylase UbiE